MVKPKDTEDGSGMEPKKAFRTKRSPRGMLSRLVRVSVTATVVLLGFGVIATKQVYGEVSNAALGFGDQLLHIDENAVAGEVGGDFYKLNVNGLPINISSGTSTTRSLTYLLDFYEDACKSHADGLVDQFQDMQGTLGKSELPKPDGFKGFGTLRGEQGRRGYVVCFAEGRDMSDTDKLTVSGEAAKDWDIGKLGDLRYVAVQDVGNATHVVAAWTHGPFELKKIFPKEGDAPGEDIPGAPRPDGSRRTLTAAAEGAPFGMVVYEAPGELDAVKDAVRGALVKAGWQPSPVPGELNNAGQTFSQGNLDLFVTSAPTSQGKTSVSYTYSRMIPRAVSP